MEKAQNNCVPAPQHQTNKHTEHCGWWTFHQLNNWISAAIKKVETNANFATLHKFAVSTFKGDHIFLQLGFTLANKSVIAGLSKGTVRVAQTLALLFFHSYQEYQPLKWIYNQSCPKKTAEYFLFFESVRRIIVSPNWCKHLLSGNICTFNNLKNNQPASLSLTTLALTVLMSVKRFRSFQHLSFFLILLNSS